MSRAFLPNEGFSPVPMMKMLLDMFLLRIKPQDLPHSRALLVGVVALAAATDFAGLPDSSPQWGHLLFVFTRPLLYGVVCWLLLKQRGFEARWVQTVIALFAALALLSLLRLPLLPALLEMVKQGAEAVLGWEVYLSLLLELWFLVLVARILREALELRPGVSAAVCIAVVFSIEIIRFILAPWFGLIDPA